VIARIAGMARRHDLLFAPGLPVETAVAALLSGKPYVLKVVGDLAWERARIRGRIGDDLGTFQTRRYAFPTELHRLAQTWAARRAARVIVPSSYLQCIVSAWGVAQARLVVIPNAAPVHLAPEAMNGHKDRAGTVGPRRFRVVTVARLVPWKGIGEVIRGVANLNGVDLLILGEGPDRPRLEGIARAVQCRAHFAGQVPHSEVFATLRTADLFILNSAYEGHPHVVLEAMALGVPVVARAAGGTPELVRHGETGVLMRTGTDAEIATTVESVRSDAELRNRIVGGGRALSGAFTLERMVDSTSRVLLGVAKPAFGGEPALQQADSGILPPRG
jgi:glycosyltransferase involved in cell wall biosynthesis